ncbi:MAG: CvpA family protein [Bacteroidota bacterium]
MAFFDIVLVLVFLLFLISGYKSGFVKKIIGIICLVLALVLGTKFSADLSQLIFEPIGISGRLGFALSFVGIVLGVTFAQSVIYRLLIKEMVEGMWNKILGVVVGIFEGGLAISITLIVLSIYLNLPSDETKGSSTFYKPLKNFAPMVFDQINTFLPESQDFYEQIMNYATEELKKLESK